MKKVSEFEGKKNLEILKKLSINVTLVIQRLKTAIELGLNATLDSIIIGRYTRNCLSLSTNIFSFISKHEIHVLFLVNWNCKHKTFLTF